jgi:hypothetical protein
MNTAESKVLRCAAYTRKSTEHNLDLAFTSLDTQREACEYGRQARTLRTPRSEHVRDDRPAAQIERSEIRGADARGTGRVQDFAALNPGYACSMLNERLASMGARPGHYEHRSPSTRLPTRGQQVTIDGPQVHSLVRTAL